MFPPFPLIDSPPFCCFYAIWLSSYPISILLSLTSHYYIALFLNLCCHRADSPYIFCFPLLLLIRSTFFPLLRHSPRYVVAFYVLLVLCPSIVARTNINGAWNSVQTFFFLKMFFRAALFRAPSIVGVLFGLFPPLLFQNEFSVKLDRCGGPPMSGTLSFHLLLITKLFSRSVFNIITMFLLQHKHPVLTPPFFLLCFTVLQT